MQYYYTQNGQQYGPFTLEELQQKSINKDTLIWRPGMEKWVGAGELSELAAIFPPIVPGPPPLPNNAYIPYRAPATPKWDRSWIGIAVVVGLVMALVVFLVWRESNKSSALVPAPTTDKTQLDKDSLDQVDREKEAQRTREEREQKEEADRQARKLQDWRDLVKIENNQDYKIDVLGGVSDLRLVLINRSDFEIILARANAVIVKKNGEAITQEVSFKNVPPGEIRYSDRIETTRGVSVGKPEVLQVQSFGGEISFLIGREAKAQIDKLFNK